MKNRKNTFNFAENWKVKFFDILKMKSLNMVVDVLKKIHFERSTIFRAKYTMFVKVNRLNMNLFF